MVITSELTREYHRHKRQGRDVMLQLLAIRWIAVLVTSFSLVSSAGCQEKQRRPNRYLIPAGYVGWVRINYKISDTPVLPIEDGFYLLRFQTDGTINTSTYGEEGFASDEYYYIDSYGRRREIVAAGDNGMIWGGVAFGSKTVRGKEPSKYAEFFVGTKEQFQQVGLKCKDNDLNPIIGRLENCLRNLRNN